MPDILDGRRKMLKFRAWRGGFREIDLILGPFADRHLPEMSALDLDAFEALMQAPDHDVYAWILGAPAPTAHDTPLLARIRAFLPDTADAIRPDLNA